jgi:lipoprotein NlpD
MKLFAPFLRLAPALSLLVVAGCVSHIPAPVVVRSLSQPEATVPEAPGSAKPGVPSADRVARQGYYLVKSGDTLFRIALDHGQAYRDIATWNNLDDPNRIEIGQELRVAPPELDDTQAVAVAKPVGMNKEVEQRPLDSNSETVKSQPKAGREAYSDEAFGRLSKSGDGGMARVVLPTESKVDAKPEPKLDAKPDLKPAALHPRGDDDLSWAWPASGKLAAQFVEGGSKGIDILGKKGDPVLAAADGKVVYSGSGLRGYGQLLIVKHNNTYLTAYAHNSRVLVKEGQSVTRGQRIAEMGDTEADQVKLHFEVRRQGKPVDPLKHLPPR